MQWKMSPLNFPMQVAQIIASILTAFTRLDSILCGLSPTSCFLSPTTLRWRWQLSSLSSRCQSVSLWKDLTVSTSAICLTSTSSLSPCSFSSLPSSGGWIFWLLGNGWSQRTSRVSTCPIPILLILLKSLSSTRSISLPQLSQLWSISSLIWLAMPTR